VYRVFVEVVVFDDFLPGHRDGLDRARGLGIRHVGIAELVGLDIIHRAAPVFRLRRGLDGERPPLFEIDLDLALQNDHNL
jgi:hypothetical protein